MGAPGEVTWTWCMVGTPVGWKGGVWLGWGQGGWPRPTDVASMTALDKHCVVVKHIDPKPRLPGFKSWLCHLQICDLEQLT